MPNIKASTEYRIDRTLNSGEVLEWYYSRSFDSEKDAQAFIKTRNPKYLDRLAIVRVDLPARSCYIVK